MGTAKTTAEKGKIMPEKLLHIALTETETYILLIALREHSADGAYELWEKIHPKYVDEYYPIPTERQLPTHDKSSP